MPLVGWDALAAHREESILSVKRFMGRRVGEVAADPQIVGAPGSL